MEMAFTSCVLVNVFFFSVVNVILIGFIPVTRGEYVFRDIRLYDKDNWNSNFHSKAPDWKYDIYTHPIKKVDDKLGGYAIVSASVFQHTLDFKKSTSVLEALENELLVLHCQRKGKYDVFLTLEKVYGIPELNILKMFFGKAKKSYVFAQLSSNRNDALESMNYHYRPNLSVGRVVWRQKNNSRITVERFLNYYTEKSAYLSAGYHMYFSNSHHYVGAIIDILQQIQDGDVGAEIKT